MRSSVLSILLLTTAFLATPHRASAEDATPPADITDGLLSMSQCVAWRQDGPDQGQVACFVLDRAFCHKQVLFAGVGSGAPLKSEYIAEDCAFKGNTASLRAVLTARGGDWQPLAARLESSTKSKNRQWLSPTGAHTLSFDGKQFRVLDTKGNAIETWDYTFDVEGVWFLDQFEAFVILAYEVNARGESEFSLKTMPTKSLK